MLLLSMALLLSEILYILILFSFRVLDAIFCCFCLFKNNILYTDSYKTRKNGMHYVTDQHLNCCSRSVESRDADQIDCKGHDDPRVKRWKQDAGLAVTWSFFVWCFFLLLHFCFILIIVLILETRSHSRAKAHILLHSTSWPRAHSYHPTQSCEQWIMCTTMPGPNLVIFNLFSDGVCVCVYTFFYLDYIRDWGIFPIMQFTVKSSSFFFLNSKIQ